MLLYAALVSTAVLFVVAAWQRKLGQAFSCSPKQYLRSAALGFLNPFLYYLVLFEAYDRLPAQEAQPLNYMWPIVVVILSVPLLKQPIGRVSLAGIPVDPVLANKKPVLHSDFLQVPSPFGFRSPYKKRILAHRAP